MRKENTIKQPTQQDALAEIMRTLQKQGEVLQYLLQKNIITKPPKVEKKYAGRQSKQGFKFNKKELEEMSPRYKKIFACDDKIIPYRYHNGVFEANYRRNGLKIFACGRDFDTMKANFKAKLALHEVPQQQNFTEVVQNKANDIMFMDYVNEWLALKKKTCKASTYKEYERIAKYHFENSFKDMPISKMTRQLIQAYLFNIVNEGKHRTAEKVCLAFQCVFDLACEDHQITNPMKKIVLPKYQTKKGRALTKEEERKLVEFCIDKKDNVASSALLVLLYFGLRKSELSSIEVKDEVLTCISSKTRLGKGELKRSIPFTPVFKKVLPYVDFEKAKKTNVCSIATALKRLLPERHVHELRYTFITRAKECGVNGEVVMLWDGHSYDKGVFTSAVDRGYTTYSQEYLLKEAQKVNYTLD